MEFTRNNGGGMQLDMQSNRLYGRARELKELHRMSVGRSIKSREHSVKTKICLVHGLSGTGKTSLVLEYARSLDGVCFLRGKYDQYTGVTSPFSAIIAAFNQLTALIQPEHEEVMEQCLKFEAGILTKLIPSFSKYDTDEKGSKGVDASLMLASERLAVAFVSFLRAFCSKCLPIVLFMDDLQWMDRHSSSLLKAILNDDDLQHFVFLGGFRDENILLVDPFLESIPRPTADIHLDNLGFEAVNELLAGLLCRSDEEIQPLSTIVFRKTAGNPYFVVQQLQNLHSQNLLVYNFATNKWEWNMVDVTGATDLSENVVDVVSSRIRALPESVFRLLKLTACLGYSVETRVLQLLDGLYGSTENRKEISENKEEEKESYAPRAFEDVVSLAVAADLLESTGPVLKFSHDRIHQCVYELIEPGTVRNLLHYEIGTHLRSLCTESTKDQFLLLAVDQLNRASSLIESDEERISLIELNSEAALIAKQRAGIENVAAFLQKATEMVTPDFWRFYYDLILDVYTRSAEVEFSLGHHEVSDQIIELILENAACERDAVRALVVKFQTLGHQRQFGKAIKEGCHILKLVGEPLPSISLPNVIIEYLKARKETKHKSDEFFTNLPPAESENIQIALKILQFGSVYGWNSGATTFSGLAFLRSMRLTVREGSCEGTPWIYSGFAFMLAELGSGKEAFRFAQLSIARGNDRKEGFPGSCILSYLNVMHWQKPISVALEPCLSAYRIGLETGDLFFGTICISCYALVYFSCGLPLDPFAVDMRCFGGQLRICRQDVALSFIVPSHQLALNLLGKSDNPVDLSRESIKRHQAEFFTEHMLDDETDAPFVYMMYLQLFNAYILEEFSVLETTLKRITKISQRRLGGTHIMNYFFALMDGLAGLALYKHKKSKAGMREAKKAKAELTKMTKTRPVNSMSLLKLLEAEQAALTQPVAKVRPMFDEVIKHFSRSGHVHYNAIANELAGKFMLKHNDDDWATHYFKRSCFLYSDWNAKVKVEQMVARHPSVRPAEESAKMSLRRSIQGKSRYDGKRDSFKSSLRQMSVGSGSLSSFTEG